MTSPGRRWVWYGGRPSLDFVNTRRNRGAGLRDSAAEYLREPADLAAWLVAAGLAARPAAGPPWPGPRGRTPRGRTSVAGPPWPGPAVAGPAVVGTPVVGSSVEGPAVEGEPCVWRASPVGGELAGRVVGSLVAGPAVAGPAVDDETFAGALALREAIDSAITAIVASGTVPERDVWCVNDWILAGPQRPVLRLEAGVPVLCPAVGRHGPRGPRADRGGRGGRARDRAAGAAADLPGARLPRPVPGRLARRLPALVLDGRVRQPEQGRRPPASRPRGGRGFLNEAGRIQGAIAPHPPPPSFPPGPPAHPRGRRNRPEDSFRRLPGLGPPPAVFVGPLAPGTQPQSPGRTGVRRVHPRYARVLITASDGDYGFALVDGNGDGAELEEELWQWEGPAGPAGRAGAPRPRAPSAISPRSWRAGAYGPALKPRFEVPVGPLGVWGFIRKATGGRPGLAALVS